jgi:2-methylcitrate dehydratase PrpD
MADESRTITTPCRSEIIAGFAEDLAFGRIPAAVIERAKLLLLDATGIAFASTRQDYGRVACAAGQALSSPGGERVVVGTGLRLGARDAALVNGILVHGLDYDDTHVAGIVHVSASLLPTVLAAGAETGASGRDLLAAFVAGIEVAARVGMVAKGGFHQVGFHPTSIAGVFGCAIAAGKLAGLGRSEFVHAQGLALSTAAGSFEFLADGAWTKRFHPGWAAASAMTTVAFAKAGFVAPRLAYEGRFGLYRAYLGERFDESALGLLTQGLGDVWETLNVAIKPYPACHFVHACIDAALEIQRAHDLAPDAIAEVEALVPAEVVKTVCEPVAQKQAVSSAYEAQFSIPYAVASGLVRRRFDLAALAPSALQEPAVGALARRVRYAIDPESGFPTYYSGEVAVRTIDGRVFRNRQHKNRGCADRPLSPIEVAEKFHANADPVIGRAKADAIAMTILGLETLASVRELERELAN